MDSRLEQGRIEETLLLPAAKGAARPRVCRPKREMVANSGPNLTNETQVLLRFRLRAAAFILLIGFGVFLVRHVAGLFMGEPLDSLLLSLHVLVVLALGFSSLPLCKEHAPSLGALRIA